MALFSHKTKAFPEPSTAGSHLFVDTTNSTTVEKRLETSIAWKGAQLLDYSRFSRDSYYAEESKTVLSTIMIVQKQYWIWATTTKSKYFHS